MKKTLLIVLAAGLLFASCKKDGGSTTTAKVSIVGKWRYKKTHTQTFDATGKSTLDVTFTAFTDADYLQYNADGTAVSMSQGSEFDFKYTYTGTTDTEYALPASAGDKPFIITVVLTSTTMTRHSQTVAPNGYKTIQDEDLTKL
jgi:hypothetical protein